MLLLLAVRFEHVREAMALGVKGCAHSKVAMQAQILFDAVQAQPVQPLSCTISSSSKGSGDCTPSYIAYGVTPMATLPHNTSRPYAILSLKRRVKDIIKGRQLQNHISECHQVSKAGQILCACYDFLLRAASFRILGCRRPEPVVQPYLNNRCSAQHLSRLDERHLPLTCSHLYSR